MLDTEVSRGEKRRNGREIKGQKVRRRKGSKDDEDEGQKGRTTDGEC